MWIFLLWVLSLFLAVTVAGNRGNNPLWAALWALVFGPFGVLIALLQPIDHARLERAEVNTGAMKRCPACAELVRPEATRCRFCAAPLAAGTAAGTDAETQRAGALSDAIPPHLRDRDRRP